MEKNPLADAEDPRDMGLISESGGSLEVGKGNPLQYSCLENTMDRRHWRAIVLRVQGVGHNGTHKHCMTFQVLGY